MILLDFEERNPQVKSFNDGELKSFSMIIIDALGGKSGVETNGEEKSLKRFKKIIFAS